MDPNATLAEIRSLAHSVLLGGQPKDVVASATELAAKFEDLDAVIMGQGRVPLDWWAAAMDAVRRSNVARG
jgi:hypothetical protein